jgi:hypothetical protein
VKIQERERKGEQYSMDPFLFLIDIYYFN